MEKRLVRDGDFKDLPESIKNILMDLHRIFVNKVYEVLEQDKYCEIRNSLQGMTDIETFTEEIVQVGATGSVRSYQDNEDKYSCMIQFTGHFRNYRNDELGNLLYELAVDVFNDLSKKFQKEYDMRLDNEALGGDNFTGFDIYPNEELSKQIWDSFDEMHTKEMKESAAVDKSSTKTNIISTLMKNYIGRPITQSILNTISTIITKEYISKWSSYKKLSLTLSSKKSYLEFIIPKIDNEFIDRFINGRETLNGLLHRSSDIKIRLSSDIFNSIKDPNNILPFIKSAIVYYDKQIERIGNQLMHEYIKLGHNMKNLISTSSLNGLVIYPLTLLFVFDDIQIENRNTFKIDTDTIIKSIRNITSRYKSSDKNKKEIIADMKSMIKTLKETCDPSENIRELSYLPESIEAFLFNRYNDMINKSSIDFIESHIDHINMRLSENTELKYLFESGKVKKLKKIPLDIIAYISIEGESIKDTNDKMMIANYALAKLELIDWYIQLLEVGSKKYIVPHTKPYLVNLKTQIMECYKKIMGTPIPKDRPLLSINYPPGYEY